MMDVGESPTLPASTIPVAEEVWIESGSKNEPSPTLSANTIPAVQEVWIESDPKMESFPPDEIEEIDDTYEIDDTNLCRVCALVKNDTIPIFGEKGRKLRLASKINKHLPITVTACDKLPVEICTECISKIQVTIDLINSCVKAQLQLAEMLVLKEKSEASLLSKVKQENDESFEDDNIGADEMFPDVRIGFPQRQNVAQEVVEPCPPEVPPGDVPPEVVASDGISLLPPSPVCNIKMEKGEAYKKKKIKEVNVKISKEAPKKPKFQVVVVKVKSNGGVPDHKQIAQTLRELHHDLGKRVDEKANPELAKEGHVVIVDKTVNLPDETSTNNNPEIGSDSFQIKFDSLENVTKVNSSSESVKLKEGEEPPVSADHSYTHWNQKHMTCGYCTETFVGRINLISHQMMAHPENVFCCFKCDQVFYDCKEDYVKHIEAHCISSKTRSRKTLPFKGEKGKELKEGEENASGNTELKVTAVARVSVDEEGRSNEARMLGPKSEQMNELKSGLRMKLSKEFDGMDPLLKNKIVGTIQKLVRRNRSSTMNRNWSCSICKLKFASAVALETHRRIKHDERIPCQYCSRLYRSESALQKHINYFHVKEFKCSVCDEQFKSRVLLRKHEFSHFGERPFQCNTCGKSYTSRGSLQIHITTHSSEKPFLCDKCGKGFKHVSNLNAHRRTHSDDPSVVKAHRCHICNKAFRCQFLVREHMRMHTGDKPFVCEHCGKSFYKKQQLRQHSAVHAAVPMFKCNVCGARFNRKGNMMQHQKRHGKEGVFTCKVCGETFSSIGLVLRHRRTHGEEAATGNGKGDPEEQDPELALAFKCDECGKFLSSKVSLTLHMRTHTGERPYSCAACGKSFSQSTSLRVHERTHTGERPFSCSSCSRAFSSRAALTNHERGHTGERPYPCKECGKSFRCAAALKQHLTTHSDDRPYPCEYCGKRFRRKEALEIHLRTHTGERPYGCKICSRRFAQKGDAKKHERTHEKLRRQGSQIDLMDDCSNSYEEHPLSLVEIETEAESATETSVSSMHASLQLEHGIVEDPYPNLPPGTIIINTQDLMTSSSEITVVAEEDLNNHILGNGISIQYEES